ncbi:MAG: hypothetical protein KAU14_03405, partial [Thermoplasmata archaeon]|nr:hypothetical protein [Thermoplasmata archaeon]
EVTNQAPSLSNSGVDPGAGEEGTIFEFITTYTDPDGESPAFIKVLIDGNEHNMTPKSHAEPQPEDLRSGVVYAFETTALNTTSHNFFFTASDGDDISSTELYLGPYVVNLSENNPPELSDGKVVPTMGTKSTQFTYSVLYRDEEDDAPAEISVTIDGKKYALTRRDGALPDYASGEIFEVVGVTRLRGNHHTFVFSATDGMADAMGDTSIHRGPVVVNTPPEILDASAEMIEENEYKFRMGYRDIDNDPPKWVKLIIDGKPFELNATGHARDYLSTVYYETRVNLTPGNHTYRFEVYDGIDKVVGEEATIEIEEKPTEKKINWVVVGGIAVAIMLIAGIIAFLWVKQVRKPKELMKKPEEKEKEEVAEPEEEKGEPEAEEEKVEVTE